MALQHSEVDSKSIVLAVRSSIEVVMIWLTYMLKGRFSLQFFKISNNSQLLHLPQVTKLNTEFCGT